MDLREALAQISEIRQQVARTETFRGYRAVPIAFSGLIALAAAACQYALLPKPAEHPEAYLTLWIGAALLSIVETGLVIGLHYYHSTCALTRSNTLLAVGQFLPSIGAGAVLTCVMVRHAPAQLWMMPGLWAILFSLGVFASYRLLPRATFWVAVYYLAAGAGCLMWAQGELAFSPLAMGVTFGFGQFLAAAILYWTLERYAHGE
jgi:hypothetical protein